MEGVHPGVDSRPTSGATYLLKGENRGMSAGRRTTAAKEIRARQHRAKKDRENKLAFDFNTFNQAQGRFQAQSGQYPGLHMLKTDAFESPERSIYLPTVHPRTQLPRPASAFD